MAVRDAVRIVAFLRKTLYGFGVACFRGSTVGGLVSVK
jgi:hypothetical protein